MISAFGYSQLLSRSKSIKESWDNTSMQLQGTIISVVGVLFLTPDTLILRCVSHTDPMTVQFYRYLFSGTTFFFYLLYMHQYKVFYEFRRIGKIGLLAGLSFGLSNLYFTVAVQSTATANVLVIFASNPMFVALFSYLFIGEVLPIQTVLACVICFCSILLIFVTELGGSEGSVEGNIFALMSSIFMGEYFALIRLGGQQGLEPDMIFCNALGLLGAAVVALILATNVGAISGRDIGFLLLQGIIVIPMSFGLLNIGTKLISASEVSLFMLIETILGPVWVYLAGFEAPPKLTVVGGSILVITLALHSLYNWYQESKRITI